MPAQTLDKQAASSEAKTAEAAHHVDMELEDPGIPFEYNPDSPLKDYNEDDEDNVPVLRKNTNGKEAVTSEDKEMKILTLREKLALNGFALRSVLMDERIQAHYVSPMSTELEMSIKNILSEIPEDELQAVAIVQDRIFIPVNFVNKWILPTLRVQKALSADKHAVFHF